MDNFYIPKIGERVEAAARHVDRCERLLVVGCGEGAIIYFLKEKVSKIYGLDKSRPSLKRAEEKGIVTKYVDLDKEKIPFRNSYFDVVTCLDVIEHVWNPVHLIKEIYRVLKSDGKIIVSAPNIRFSDHLWTLLIKGHFPITSEDKSAYDGGHIHYFTFLDLRDILKNAGFKIIHEEGIINRAERGLRGKIGEKILGKKFMREFRSPGILIIGKKAI